MSQQTAEMPLVTIYIPTKNRAKLLARAICSCLNQDYPHLEILVVDDGSKPDEAVAIAKLCATDARIRLLRNAQSLGAPAARNSDIAQARGDYITGLDDDDEFLPGRISCFVQAAAQTNTPVFFCSGYQYQLVSGQRVRGLCGVKSIDLSALLFKNDVGNQIFCQTKLLQQIGGFDPQLQACQDYDLWVRLALSGVNGVRLNVQNYLVHQEHELPRISTTVRRRDGQLQFAQKHRPVMTSEQYKAQMFYAKLYSGAVTLWQIVTECPIRLWPLALKMTVLRWFGRQV